MSDDASGRVLSGTAAFVVRACAALDLADMGIQTVLVEKEPSIGGKMAQLNKTFPTMDCSI